MFSPRAFKFRFVVSILSERCARPDWAKTRKGCAANNRTKSFFINFEGIVFNITKNTKRVSTHACQLSPARVTMGDQTEEYRWMAVPDCQGFV
jgi:hypothetical protein